ADQTDLQIAGTAQAIDDLHEVAVLQRGVAAYEDGGALVTLGGQVKHRPQALQSHLLVAHVQAVVFLDAQVDRLVRALGRFGAGGRQVQLHDPGGQGRRHHEDDQQQQHDVDERGDVDLAVLRQIVAATFLQLHAHGSAYLHHVGHLALAGGLVIQVTADQQQYFGSGIAQLCPETGNGTGEDVVEHHSRNRCDQADGGGQQRLGDTGRHHGEVG